MSLRLIDEKNGDTLHTVIPEVFYRGSIHAKNRFLLTEFRNDGAVWLHFSKWRKLMGNQEEVYKVSDNKAADKMNLAKKQLFKQIYEQKKA